MSSRKCRHVTVVAMTIAGLVVGGASAFVPSVAIADPAPGSPASGLAKGLAGLANRSGLDKSRLESTVPRIGVAGKKPAQGQLPAGVPASGKYAFLLQLAARSTMSVYASTVPQGKAAASSAARSQLRTVQSVQDGVTAALPSGTRVLYRTHSALAGLAVYTDVHNYSALQAISGVQAVYPIAPKKPSNSFAVPFQKAPDAWQATGDTGANSKIAIIDTGIDYTHANFGGPGTTAVYNTAKAADNQTADPSLFPSAKVIGGTDLVGDAYDAGSNTPADTIPVPDPNPLDCNGHGSHVAGSAAGFGENADGTTYTGVYNTTTPFDTMKIGPGMAPGAKLYAYKVFGCAGSTNVVAEAIDLATDPNQDGIPDDHVQVINMSLGADFGSQQDGDAVVANAASNLGVSVVIASGNAGDLYDAGGSPGDAPRAITVANSVDARDQLDTLTVSAPAGIAGDYGAERSIAYDWGSKPDLSGTLVALSDPNNKDGCDPLNTADAAAVNGKIAFLEWTDDDQVRRCGSVTRSGNVKKAGAIGFVFADDQETFAAGITGDPDIPGVLVTKSAGDAIRAQLGAGVTVSGTSAGTFRQEIPANNDKVNSGSSRGVHGAGNVKPDVAAVGTGVFSTAVGTGTGGTSESGTSMATPMVAGLAALVRSVHPAWTPEQVKADIMNTAGQDLFTGDNHTGAKYAPNRVGAGRINAQAALANSVVAYVQDNPGAVSVSFGPVAIVNATQLTKTVKVTNFGATDATYALSYDAIDQVPGVAYQVVPNSIIVPAGGSGTFTVSLVVSNPALLTKTLDPTMDRAQAGGIPREFLADASGRVVLTPSDASQPTLRVPVYSAPRPASAMTQPSQLTLPSGSLQKANTLLSGKGVSQGIGDQHVESAVAGFELQASSGLAPACSATRIAQCVHFSDERSADVKYVGITSDRPQATSLGMAGAAFVYFSITTQGPWRTAASTQEFDIPIDTNNDGNPDAILFNTRLSAASDIFVSVLLDANTGNVLDVEPIDNRLGDQDMALLDSDTLIMPVFLHALPGISSANPRIRYGVASFSNESAGPIDLIRLDAFGDLVNPLSADVVNPGIVLYGNFTAQTNWLLYSDQPGGVLVTRRVPASYFADHGLGALVVHYHNGVGGKAKVMALKTASKVSLSLVPSQVTSGSTITATVTVANAGSVTPTGTVTLRKLGQSTPFASARLSGGRAVIRFRPFTRGTFYVVARYSGDGNYLAGTSPAVRMVVT